MMGARSVAVVGLLATFAGLFAALDKECHRPALTLEELPADVQAWERSGNYIEVFGRRLFYIDTASSAPAAKRTFLVVHGFPSSSFEYHRALPLLAAHGRVVIPDHLGFGLSDKPPDHHYSLFDHAENLLELCRLLSLSRVDVIAHDMGDSVTTELLSRLERGMAPLGLHELVRSLTFTNGGMYFPLIQQRLAQKLYISPLAPYLPRLLPSYLAKRFSDQQLASIWGEARDSMPTDIAAIQALI
eukprot:7343243-Prymnesium_polylepis.1